MKGVKAGGITGNLLIGWRSKRRAQGQKRRTEREAQVGSIPWQGTGKL